MNVSLRSEQDSNESISNAIRVGSIAIAIYECVPLDDDTFDCVTPHPYPTDDSYLLTLPAEWRFWKSQLRRNQIRLAHPTPQAFRTDICPPISREPSASFCLFILLR
jgi:hypothetical protein